ncbi:MAG: nitrile hydratase accessory protein [Stappiaceae bacterium]
MKNPDQTPDHSTATTPCQKGFSPLAGQAGEPVFSEPWQAQILALAYSLVHDGNFSAQAWAETLGAHLKHAEKTGQPDDKDTYYRCALSALEELTGQHTEISKKQLDVREDAWRRAHLNTPHGQPVELSAAQKN